ncbi:bifunctional hydroxymethylpyrimidine kinase/phosphomethylpyrimidine kinase [Filimonas effusa]|uniref:hydroxymethylpyrimidine kinase n=1 Tax=Filimonas effusa TaxID=2508721 RepID=A0A4Q1DCP4_9BACT|nr:bifunctional hydroxymethylpyrimidine kinase/phosphomethylpyrimidine kinase [Filimonas effusa]RXK86738.1 bifunctional hydroxymethylpyrimidine kinase/phosphomethylpyrimidine kinase [Filimonas effusa]
MKRYPTVLTIAGSDSGGGAGIQADIKTISALGAYATTAVTAVTAQNTLGVTDIHVIPASVVEAQIRTIMDDMPPAAIKTGMIAGKGQVFAIATALLSYPATPLIVDPVMSSSRGQSLAEEGIHESLQQCLFPMATLVTPNLKEAALLTGIAVTDLPSMQQAASRILAMGARAVLVKGGHLKNTAELYDVYRDAAGDEQVYRAARIDSLNLHGTGCTLSSAIAALLARGMALKDAIAEAKNYMNQAIAAGKDVVSGEGPGPLNHFFRPLPLQVFN